MSSYSHFFLTLLLTLLWSPSFLFIKLAVTELPPLTVVSLRVTIAAIILTAILFFKKGSFPKNIKFWLRISVMAFFASALPFSLFCFAETTIDSALAAILNGTTPMFTAIMAHYFVSSDRLTFQKAFGVILSTLGVLILFTPKIQEGLSATSMGMLAALVAAFSYAISHIYGKLYSTKQPPFVAPAAQFLMTSLMLWPFAFFYDNVFQLPMPSYYAMGGVLGLAVFGTSIAFIIYYRLLDQCGPTAISMAACFFPVVGMLLGFLFLNEDFTLVSLFGAAMILFGMLCVNNIIYLPYQRKQVA